MNDRYGIVVDAGSSGSRIQVYKWVDDPGLGTKLPEIILNKNWGKKVSPGISTFGNKPGKVWNQHLKTLAKFAEEIIPKDKQRDTPIFVQATAGMRMLPPDRRQKVLDNVVSSLRKHTKFRVGPQDVQVIDGETEGLYGWLALNYLEKRLDTGKQSTFGFMDMGGASTQIAFVPSSRSEQDKYKEVLSTVRLRNEDGSTQEWPVFVSTWLGFGANEARRRHLRNLIMALPEGVNYDKNGDSTYDITDPCSPKGMLVQQEYKGITYDITGAGNYEQCLRTIYPLLLKHLPCKGDTCLFNGVDAPEIDFDHDRFIGVSEYWYTANDVFQMAGEYNFKQFENRLKTFCEAEWPLVESNFEKGMYGENMQLPFLRDSCFKASWVVNILHEGFGLPRVGIEAGTDAEAAAEPTFQSVNTVNGADLSWSLGKILVYASSQVAAAQGGKDVGVFPSPAHKLELERLQTLEADTMGTHPGQITSASVYVLFFLLMAALGVYFLVTKRRLKVQPLLSKIGLPLQRAAHRTKQKLRELSGSVAARGDSISVAMKNLEEGRSYPYQNSGLRTRSSAALQDLRDGSPNTRTPSPPDNWTQATKPGLAHSQSVTNFSRQSPAFDRQSPTYDIMSKRFPGQFDLE